MIEYSKMINCVFFDGVSFTSNGIRFFTRSKWGHEAIEVSPSASLPLIEAWHFEDGLRWGYSSYDKHTPGTEYEVWGLPVSQDEYDYCMGEYDRYARTKMPYDRIGIVGFVLKWKRDSKKGMFCSEGCSRSIIEKRKYDINPAHVSPEDAYRMVQFAGGELIRKGVC